MYTQPKRFSSFLVPMVMTHLVMSHLVMTISGCSYDWDVGPPGSSQSSTSSTSATSSSTSTSSNGSGGIDAGADCVALAESLETARANAKACMFGIGGQCTASITDERGCTSWVNDAANMQTITFTNAVDDFLAAGCVPSTQPCGMSVPTCLYVMGKPECVP